VQGVHYRRVTYPVVVSIVGLLGLLMRMVRIEARRLSADDRFTSMTRLRAVITFLVPKIRALYETAYFAGLRKAGMPEE
jgi:hypothetical protein